MSEKQFQNEVKNWIFVIRKNVSALTDLSFELNTAFEELFRIIHSIKSFAAFSGFTQIQNLGHTLEEIIYNFQEETISWNKNNRQVFQNALDNLQTALGKAVFENIHTDTESIKSTAKLVQILAKSATKFDDKVLSLPLSEEIIPEISPLEWEMIGECKRQNLNIFEIPFGLDSDILKNGQDPTRLFAALLDLGEIISVVPLTNQLPDWSELGKTPFDLQVITLLATHHSIEKTSAAIGKSSQDIRLIFAKDTSGLEHSNRAILEISDKVYAEIATAKKLGQNVFVLEAKFNLLDKASASQAFMIHRSLAEIGAVVAEYPDIQNIEHPIELYRALFFTNKAPGDALHYVDTGHAAEKNNIRNFSFPLQTEEMDFFSTNHLINYSLPKKEEQQSNGKLASLIKQAEQMAKELSKDVVFISDGPADIWQLPIFDKLYEPMMHLLRNAVDHGVDDANKRRNHGKPGQARISIVAQRDDSQIRLVVQDDGKGINFKQLRQKIKEKELLPIKKVDLYSDDQILEYLFNSGLSTKKSVSIYSGRGYGLDIVKKCIEELRGTISINSFPDFGTRFTITIPSNGVKT